MEHTEPNFEGDFSPSAGRHLICFSRYVSQNNSWTYLGRIMSSPVVLMKIAQELQGCVLTPEFFLKDVFDGERTWSLSCRKGVEMSLSAYVSKWFLWRVWLCTVHHSDLTEGTFVSGEFQCSVYFTTNGEKVCACFSGRGMYYSEVYIYFSGTSACIEISGSFY